MLATIPVTDRSARRALDSDLNTLVVVSFEICPILVLVTGIEALRRKYRFSVPWTRYLSLALVSFPLGLIAYLTTSWKAASIRGDGHFYSVPFGGYTVLNSVPMACSLLIWIALVFVLLALIFLPKISASPT